MDPADINFYFDPVCPFSWMTSKWVRLVQQQRDYTVDWRFISLRLINAEVDYDAQFPPEYEAGHTAGLRLLRVAARARAEHGRAAMAPLYAAFGAKIFDSPPRRRQPPRSRRGSAASSAAPGSSSSRSWPRPGCRSTWPTRWTTPPGTQRSGPRARRAWPSPARTSARR